MPTNTMICKSPFTAAFGLSILLYSFSSCNLQIDPVKTDVHTSFSVSSVFPMEGDPGSHVTIQGTGFSKDSLQNHVLVNGLTAQLVHSSETSIEAILPETNGTSVDIRVEVHHIQSANSFSFQYYDVYVAGSVSGPDGVSLARLWKNGKVEPLSADSTRYSSASSLLVDGGNVYVGTNGGYFRNSTFIPVYPASEQSSLVKDMKIHDGAMYVTAPRGYYKDKAFTSLIGGHSPEPSINALLFDGNTLYAAGSDIYGDGAVEFKNDHLVGFALNEFHSGIESMIMHKGELHAVGQYLASIPSEWVDGKGKQLTLNNSTILKDVQFIGDDEYLVSSPASKKHAYFANGTEVLPRPATYFEGRKLAVQGKNIYAAGISSPFFDNSHVSDAAYYHNNELVVLDKGHYVHAEANSIVVVKR